MIHSPPDGVTQYAFSFSRNDAAMNPVDILCKAYAGLAFVACLCALSAAGAGAREEPSTDSSGPIAATEFVDIDSARLYLETRGDRTDASWKECRKGSSRPGSYSASCRATIDH